LRRSSDKSTIAEGSATAIQFNWPRLAFCELALSRKIGPPSPSEIGYQTVQGVERAMRTNRQVIIAGLEIRIIARKTIMDLII